MKKLLIILLMLPTLALAQTKTAREDYARDTEHRMLENGMDATVRTSGKDARTLTIKYVMINRPYVHNFANSGTITDRLSELGFTKVIMTDGYNDSWTLRIK